MKVKHDFVTNSSSTCYIIQVNVEQLDADVFLTKLLVDEEFRSEVRSYDDNVDDLEQNALQIVEELESRYKFPLSKGRHNATFGDEHGTIIGRTLDYCVREGFVCEDFEIMFDRHNR